MKRQDFRHLERLRVRWAEVDLQKIVFNGHYLMYADTAVAGYWRALAMPYHQTMELLQGDLYVRKATLEYVGSARYDEQLEVGIRCARIGKTSLVFETAVYRGDAVLVHGELVYVFADPKSMTSQPVPDLLRTVFTAFEDGAPMLDVAIEPWAAAAAELRLLREQVLVQVREQQQQQQQLPAVLVEDPDDQRAVHVVARNRFGLLVGAGRVVLGSDGVAQLGRMVVLASLHGAGAGRLLLQSLMRAAKDGACTVVALHASSAAAGFYAREGFSAVGAAFEHAGVQHQAMRRSV